MYGIIGNDGEEIMYQYYSFHKKIDRRSPHSKGDPFSPVLRENWLSRDMRLKKVPGSESVTSQIYLSTIPHWMGRYYTIETGIISPKTFIYTKDGRLWRQNDLPGGNQLEIKSGLNTNAYPRHWLYKLGEQVYKYFVDGLDLYEYDGNNAFRFDKVALTDASGGSIYPIDIIEHKDRLILLTKTHISISANLDPKNHSSATDSLHVIIGSGQGENLAFGKIEDFLFVLNTEGIFALQGDTISALAPTWSIEKVDSTRIIAGRSLCAVENGLIFLDDTLNLQVFNGTSCTKLSNPEKLEDFISPKRPHLDRVVATYEDNYYKMSFIENGQAFNNMEVWYDTLSDDHNIDFIRGRNVSCYLRVDRTKEEGYQQFGRSDVNKIMWAGRGRRFDSVSIRTRLFTRDITPQEGLNVRFKYFYPEFEPTGDRNINISYILDGRLGTENYWTQNLYGESFLIGLMPISNQNQFTDRALPKIDYARGQSIAFYISDETQDMDTSFLGIGIEFIGKKMKKGKAVGA